MNPNFPADEVVVVGGRSHRSTYAFLNSQRVIQQLNLGSDDVPSLL